MIKEEGKTTTLGGKIVWKNDLRVSIPGTIDELNHFLSVAKNSIRSQNNELFQMITWIQTCLFIIGSRISDPYCKSPFTIQITEKEVAFLETACKNMDVEKPNKFIFIGNNIKSCNFNIARVTTRRLERELISYVKHFPNHKISQETFSFINRLSYFLYLCCCQQENGDYDYLDWNFIQEFPKLILNKKDGEKI